MNPMLPWTAALPTLAIAWLATYLLHSTLLLGGAWLAGRRLERRDPALAELLWRLALLGGLATATLQVGYDTLLAAESARGAATAATAAVERPGLAMPTSSIAAAAVPRGDRAPQLRGGATLAPAPIAGPVARALARNAGWVLPLWILGAVGSLACVGATWLGLARRLRGRQAIRSGPLRATLDALLDRVAPAATVRLSSCPRLHVPLAIGIAEREICLPSRALAGLEPRAQVGLLAHELAHLERRDPVWLLAARLIEGLLFVQPLNRVAGRRLRDAAEYLCDARAVAWTGDHLGLARCLTEVAGWVVRGEARGVALAPAMASSPSVLRERVHRLLAAPASDRTAGARLLALASALAVLVAIGVFAPGASPAAVALAVAQAPAASAGEPLPPPADEVESPPPATPELVEDQAGVEENELWPEPGYTGEERETRSERRRAAAVEARHRQIVRRLERELDRPRAEGAFDAGEVERLAAVLAELQSHRFAAGLAGAELGEAGERLAREVERQVRAAERSTRAQAAWGREQAREVEHQARAAADEARLRLAGDMRRRLAAERAALAATAAALPRAEELEALLAEVRRQVEASLPDIAEMRRQVEAAKPDIAELQRLTDEARRAAGSRIDSEAARDAAREAAREAVRAAAAAMAEARREIARAVEEIRRLRAEQRRPRSAPPTQ